MSARVPLFLFVVAAVLLGYILAFERGGPSQSEIASRSGFLVESFVRDRITRVHIGSGDEAVILRRDGEGFDETWTLEHPEEAPADPEPVEDYLRNWEFAVPIRTLEEPSDADVEQFGIDSPKGQVILEMGRHQVRIVLGSEAPVDGGGYVRIADSQPVAVVGKDVVALFERSAEAFAIAGDGGAPLLSDLEDASGDAGPDAAEAER